jgi:phage-related protein
MPFVRSWRFYRSAAGSELARDELRELPTIAQANLTEAMKRKARGQELAREDEIIRGRLRAVRTTADGREYRALYARLGRGGEILLAVRVTEKKSKKLPKQDIDLALNRLADWEARGQERKHSD